MKVGIVGSRSFKNFAFLENIVLEWEKTNGTIKTVVSGGAQGVDRLAEQYAKKYDKETIIHNADWNMHGKSAGPMRNSKIVEDSDAVIALPSKKSIGTFDTIRKTQKAKKKIDIHYVD